MNYRGADPKVSTNLDRAPRGVQKDSNYLCLREFHLAYSPQELEDFPLAYQDAKGLVF